MCRYWVGFQCHGSDGTSIANYFAMKRVLLVEDSADVLFVLKIELEESGYEVDAVLDAADALELVQHRPPDIIVSDLGMPGMNGLDFMKRIRKMTGFASVPAIALTGASLDRDVQKALACGFTAHLTKPVDPKELANRIEQLTLRRFERKAS
jgi:two-component system CheB/CheR fusion protein